MNQTVKIRTILEKGFTLGIFYLSASTLYALPALALDDNALPNGGQITGGAASLDYSNPGELHIYQSSNLAVIDWAQFNIGTNALTQFHQPGAGSVVVNRVTGNGDPTQILGTLVANGIVMVLDRNGVIFGKDSRVDVGGIIASTGSLDSAAFMDNGTVALSDIASGGYIINHGMISVADAGLAAFVAPSVINHGIITAKLGRILIGSGDVATLDLYGDGLLEVAVTDDDIQQQLVNTGTIHAEGGLVQMSAATAKDVVNSVINIEGVVSASSATVQGGKIILGSGNITLAENAVIDASSSAAKGGEVIIYAKDTTHIAGTIKAAGSSGDHGGFIETSAANRVTIADSAIIDTGNGQWLIDPTNFTIANSGGDITTATLAAQLATNNITIETADAGGDAGDIFVSNALTWTGNKSLTLKAHRNIEVNAAITNTTGGSLLLRADKNGTGTGTVNFGASGSAAMSGGGRTDIYYNPAVFNSPTNYSSKMTGSYTAWILVNNVTQLQAMNTRLSGTYALGRDIDASDTVNWNAGAGFNSIGSGGAQFSGQFDGLGHTITGLTINRPGTSDIGFFGYANGATIRNVGVINSTITGNESVGGLIGNSQGNSTILNSYVTGTITSIGKEAGGLVGYGANGTITDSHFSGAVSGGSTHVGGLVGSSAVTITNSYTTGTVSGTGNYVGGLVGTSNQNITNSYSTSNITGAASYVGGVTGQNNNGITISNSYATGTVMGANTVGGLAGSNNNGIITDSYATGMVSGTVTGGGLVGSNSGTITNSYATGNVSSTANSGNLGGLVGSHSGTITNSYATGSISSTRTNAKVGGLVGYSAAGTITNSYATGSVSAPSSYVGGLIGRYDAGTLTSTYWNNQTSGQATSAGGGTGLTTAQMMQMASFSGWNISDEGAAGTIWRIYEGYTSPLLTSFLTALTVHAAEMTTTYDGSVFSGGSATYTGFKSGDDETDLLGTLGYGGTSQGAVNAGSYGITLVGGLYSGQQGYDISYDANPATLTIAKRDITATVHDDSRAHGISNPIWDWTNVTWNNLVGGQDGSILDTFLVESAADAASEGGLYDIIISGFSDNNYNLTGFTPGILTVGAKAALLPIDIVRIANAKRSASSPEPGTPDTLLVDPKEAADTMDSSTGCLAMMADGPCVVR